MRNGSIKHNKNPDIRLHIRKFDFDNHGVALHGGKNTVFKKKMVEQFVIHKETVKLSNHILQKFNSKDKR